MKNTMALIVAVLGTVVSFAVGAAAKADLGLVPWPKSMESRSGSLELTAKSRIVAMDASLLPLAKVLSEEILQTTGRQLAAVQGEPAKGDIVLKLDPQLKGEAYALDIADQAVVTGANYPAAAWGMVTLLQALTAKDGKLSLPRLKIADQPDYRMSAIQMRIPHFSPETGEAAWMGDRQ